MNQVEFLEKVLELKAIHPDYDIKILVDNEFASEFGWTHHRIYKVEISLWIEVADVIYTYRDSAVSAIEDQLDDLEELTDEEFADAVEKYFDEHVSNAICIYTNAARRGQAAH